MTLTVTQITWWVAGVHLDKSLLQNMVNCGKVFIREINCRFFARRRNNAEFWPINNYSEKLQILFVSARVEITSCWENIIVCNYIDSI